MSAKLKFIFLIVLVGMLFFGFQLLKYMPYHLYLQAANQGVNTRFLQIKKVESRFLEVHDILEFKAKLNLREEQVAAEFFKLLHFNQYLIPFPINLPGLSLVPKIELSKNTPILGGDFIDHEGNEVVKIKVIKPKKFSLSHFDQSLFSLPYFKNFIEIEMKKNWWNDLFTLSIDKNPSMKKYYEYPFNKWVYDLFIFKNREYLFSNETVNINFDEKRELGIVEVNDLPNWKKFHLYFLNNGILNELEIKAKKNNVLAQIFLKHFLSVIEFKESSADSSIALAAEYKTFSYQKKTNQDGMTYLYAAWSHDLENRDFVRVIILFLERGKATLAYLKPFYEYAYKKFGTNLSKEGELIFESAEDLKHKTIENRMPAQVEESAIKKAGDVKDNHSRTIEFNSF